MYKDNPKLEGSNIIDVIPQNGPCPMNCNQCFYNRPGAFYAGMKSNIPSLKETKNKIVRMNCGHDSNFDKELVIKTAKKYKHFFFNTSINNTDFPGPVVLTINPKEETEYYTPDLHKNLDNLMFVRVRVSDTNLSLVDSAVKAWTSLKIPVVLTFMAYYSRQPVESKWYTWKVRHVNSYWCVIPEFMEYVLDREKNELGQGGNLVTTCGTFRSNYCRDCKNCETYYWQTLKRMIEI
jgi:hypothetical protein